MSFSGQNKNDDVNNPVDLENLKNYITKEEKDRLMNEFAEIEFKIQQIKQMFLMSL